MNKPLLTLAPMAGFTDRAMRLMCSEYSCDIATTEMVSAKAIHYKDKKTDTLAVLDKLNMRQAIQIFGSEPDIMAEAAEHLNNIFKPDYIDINMGCPVKKIAGNGDGSALMREPDKVAKIVKSVVCAVPVPVTVKIRSGWDENEKNAVEIAKICEDNGAFMITVHGRTKKQLYAPPVDIGIIKKVKQSVGIPVIANGGILTPEDGINMLSETGCDGLALARGILGAPWLFKQIRSLIETGKYDIPDNLTKINTAKRHLALEIMYKGNELGVRESKVVLGHYLVGLRGASQARLKINMSNTKEEIEEILDRILIDNT